ncbi:MAG TPA: efflux RND transporter periplasmic adaptor subunit [Steroidobacteraceae bacterium]|nr:efflux RND transporter periplasmic adaptor subunit [Steroidobacteraceae bacterium]
MNKKVLMLLILAAVAIGGCGGSGPATQTTAAPAADDEHAESAGDRVKLTAEQISTAGIVVADAGPAAIRETLPVYGVIAPNAERVRDVGARFPGIIRNVAKKIGDPVRQGEKLATIESNESLQTYAVVAPLDGVVTARNANPGEQSGEKVLFTVADLSTVWVELSLFPRDIAKVRVGQTARVKSSDTGLSADGKIVYVAPFGSSTNQTLTARVLLDNAERRWAPGLYVTAEIALSQSEVPLAIRSEALQTFEGATVVFVHDEDAFEARPVRTGRTDGQWSEVTEGLKAGERYAAANSFIVKAELGKGAAEHED